MLEDFRRILAMLDKASAGTKAMVISITLCLVLGKIETLVSLAF